MTQAARGERISRRAVPHRRVGAGALAVVLSVNLAVLLAVFLTPAPQAFGQTRPNPVPPRQPPPPPERVYPGAVDRPLAPPDVLRDDRVNLDSGVQIGLGPQSVALHAPKLKLDDAPTLSAAEGVVISADVLLGNFRVGYSRQFYRRVLPVGSSYQGQSVNFLSVDGDQILGIVGWRPWHGIFLGAVGGAEYRLVRIKKDATNVETQTETTGVVGVVADLEVAVPFSLQVRVLRETAARLVQLDSTILQLSYIIPF